MNARAAVLDSTCLIALERVGRMTLLPGIFGKVLAPPAVGHELGALPSWLQIQPVENWAMVTALQLTLGRGESEALALASERGLLLVTDDLKARRAAAKLGVRCTGTIGILLRAKLRGVLPVVMPVITQMEEAGFFLTESLKQEARRLSHE